MRVYIFFAIFPYRHSEGLCPEESIKIQGTKDRYALRKQRGLTMIAKAANGGQAGNSLLYGLKSLENEVNNKK